MYFNLHVSFLRYVLLLTLLNCVGIPTLTGYLLVNIIIICILAFALVIKKTFLWSKLYVGFTINNLNSGIRIKKVIFNYFFSISLFFLLDLKMEIKEGELKETDK